MPRFRNIFVLFTAAYFLSYFFRSANAVIAPDLSRALSLNAAELGLMTSLFFAAFAAVQLPLGVALDRWGARAVTPALMLVGAAGSLTFALAPSFAVLALGRSLIGVGMAGILMGALKAFSQWLPPERFATYSGLLVGIGSAGALLAATPLALLNQAVGWRAVFAAGAVIVAAVAAAMALRVRNTPPGVPWTGGHDDAHHLRTVFKDLRFWRLAPHNFFFAGSVFAFQALWAGPYLYDVGGVSEVVAGNHLLLLAAGATAGYTISGFLADGLGIARTITTGSIAFILLVLLLAAMPPLAVMGPAYGLLGLSGGVSVMLLAQARQVFPAAITGQAVTAVNLFGIGGTFVLQWVMGLMVDAHSADAAGRYPPAAYRNALLLLAVGAGLSLLWYLAAGRMLGRRTSG